MHIYPDKMVEKTNLGKEPLPGERQGTSGVDAGRDSMRDIDPVALTERTYRIQKATAQPKKNKDHEPPKPAAAVLPDDQSVTTKAGKIRQRITWTYEMNTHVMYCYYKASKLETIRSGYRPELRRLFLEKYPTYSMVTEQRLMDQKRVIIKNNRLTQQQIEAIKQTISNETQNRSNAETEEDNIDNDTHGEGNQIHTQNRHVNEAVNQDNDINTSITAITQNDNLIQIQEVPANIHQQNNIENNYLIEEFQQQYNKWIQVPPENRPRLIKPHFNQAFEHNLIVLNRLIYTVLEDSFTLTQTHAVLYSAAYTALKINKQEPTATNKIKQHKKPKWQIRLENKIDQHRQQIGRLTQYINGNRSKRLLKRLQPTLQDQTKPPIEILDTLKQKLAVYSTRLRRYTEANLRRRQNNMFYNNEKQFYKTLNDTEKINIIPPSQDEITDFWKSIWNKPQTHNRSATWINNEIQMHSHIETTNYTQFTIEELQQTIKKTHNWKSPGIDGIQNYWYKKFTSTHKQLTTCINDIIQNPTKLPPFLTLGRTYIQPKNRDTQNPANYRPITCLPTLYKIITSLITQRIEEHLHKNNILTEEQKGCKKKSQGCKEQLIIDSTILQQAEHQQRNLYTCYIDYKKAFDSVPHSWLQHILEIYKIPNTLTSFLKHAMTTWRTRVQLRTDTQTIQTEDIQIQRGIFQGDSLSALWFCICLNPLSNSLNQTPYGYNIKNRGRVLHTVSHLMYMDDIKLYGSTQHQIRQLIKITEDISNDIKMEFGLDKCKILAIERGKWSRNDTIQLNNNQEITQMQEDDTYKYLGFYQNTKLNHNVIKEQLSENYEKRVTAILKSKLNSKNIIKAINTYAIPLLTYSFGIIKWTKTDTEALDRTNRTMLTKYRMHHPHSATERTTLPRYLGGRGLVDITELHNNQIENLRKYFYTKEDSPLHRSIVRADTRYTPLNLSEQTHNYERTKQNDNQAAQKTEDKLRQWSQKKIHGKHFSTVQQPYINKKLTYKWLTTGELQPETEGFTIAIQDQVIPTRNYTKHIMKNKTIQNDKCRKCHQFSETIEHITSGCKLMAGTDYTERHNTVAKIIHQEIATKHNLITEQTPYYKYQPETIMENQEIKLYWDLTLRTDKTIAHNRPDITIFDKQKKIIYLLDIAVPNENNMEKKYHEKIEKYTPLAIELEQIYKQNKVIILPFILSPTGVTPHTFAQNLDKINIPTKVHTKAQKAVILKTCNIVRKFLNPHT